MMVIIIVARLLSLSFEAPRKFPGHFAPHRLGIWCRTGEEEIVEPKLDDNEERIMLKTMMFMMVRRSRRTCMNKWKTERDGAVDAI